MSTPTKLGNSIDGLINSLSSSQSSKRLKITLGCMPNLAHNLRVSQPQQQQTLQQQLQQQQHLRFADPLLGTAWHEFRGMLETSVREHRLPELGTCEIGNNDHLTFSFPNAYSGICYISADNYILTRRRQDGTAASADSNKSRQQGASETFVLGRWMLPNSEIEPAYYEVAHGSLEIIVKTLEKQVKPREKSEPQGPHCRIVGSLTPGSF